MPASVIPSRPPVKSRRPHKIDRIIMKACPLPSFTPPNLPDAAGSLTACLFAMCLVACLFTTVVQAAEPPPAVNGITGGADLLRSLRDGLDQTAADYRAGRMRFRSEYTARSEVNGAPAGRRTVSADGTVRWSEAGARWDVRVLRRGGTRNGRSPCKSW